MMRGRGLAWCGVEIDERGGRGGGGGVGRKGGGGRDR